MKDKKQDGEYAQGEAPSGVIAESALSALTFDSQHFAQEIEAMDIDPKQAEALLENLWHIMAGFVDMGWGVDSVQLFLPDLFENVARDSANLIESKTEDNKGAHHD